MNLSEIRRWIQLTKSSGVKIHLIHDIQNLSGLKRIRELVDHSDSESLLLTEGCYGSPGLARNVGLEVLDTPWFTFWDSDDLVDISTFLDTVEKLDVQYDAYVSDYYFSTGKAKILKKLSQTEQTMDEVARNPGIWRIIYKSKFFESTRFKDFLMGEDQIYLVESRFSSSRICHVPTIWYMYVKNSPTQLTNSQMHLNSLSRTINYNLEYIKVQKASPDKFHKIILSKQIITNFKYGDFFSVLSVAKCISKFIFTSNPLKVFPILVFFLKELFFNLNRKFYEK